MGTCSEPAGACSRWWPSAACPITPPNAHDTGSGLHACACACETPLPFPKTLHLGAPSHARAGLRVCAVCPWRARLLSSGTAGQGRAAQGIAGQADRRHARELLLLPSKPHPPSQASLYPLLVSVAGHNVFVPPRQTRWPSALPPFSSTALLSCACLAFPPSPPSCRKGVSCFGVSFPYTPSVLRVPRASLQFNLPSPQASPSDALGRRGPLFRPCHLLVLNHQPSDHLACLRTFTVSHATLWY